MVLVFFVILQSVLSRSSCLKENSVLCRETGLNKLQSLPSLPSFRLIDIIASLKDCGSLLLVRD